MRRAKIIMPAAMIEYYEDNFPSEPWVGYDPASGILSVWEHDPNSVNVVTVPAPDYLLAPGYGWVAVEFTSG